MVARRISSDRSPKLQSHTHARARVKPRQFSPRQPGNDTCNLTFYSVTIRQPAQMQAHTARGDRPTTTLIMTATPCFPLFSGPFDASCSPATQQPTPSKNNHRDGLPYLRGIASLAGWCPLPTPSFHPHTHPAADCMFRPPPPRARCEGSPHPGTRTPTTLIGTRQPNNWTLKLKIHVGVSIDHSFAHIRGPPGKGGV